MRKSAPAGRFEEHVLRTGARNAADTRAPPTLHARANPTRAIAFITYIGTLLEKEQARPARRLLRLWTKGRRRETSAHTPKALRAPGL